MASAFSLSSSADQRSKANSIELRSRSRNNGLTSISKLTGSVGIMAPFCASTGSKPAEGVSPQLGEPLDEVEGGLGDLAPAVIDGEGVAAVRHLHDLRYGGIALLPLVGGVRDRPRHGVILLAVDDQQGSTIGSGRVHLRLCPRVEVCVAHLDESDPGA